MRVQVKEGLGLRLQCQNCVALCRSQTLTLISYTCRWNHEDMSSCHAATDTKTMTLSISRGTYHCSYYLRRGSICEPPLTCTTSWMLETVEDILPMPLFPSIKAIHQGVHRWDARLCIEYSIYRGAKSASDELQHPHRTKRQQIRKSRPIVDLLDAS